MTTLSKTLCFCENCNNEWQMKGAFVWYGEDDLSEYWQEPGWFFRPAFDESGTCPACGSDDYLWMEAV